eukprot:IDg3017t1
MQTRAIPQGFTVLSNKQTAGISVFNRDITYVAFAFPSQVHVPKDGSVLVSHIVPNSSLPLRAFRATPAYA